MIFPPNQRMQQDSYKQLRYGKMKQEENNEGPLNIQAKSILNPSMKDSSGFLNKIALQNKNTTK